MQPGNDPKALFTKANYKFSTQEDERLSTLYFEDSAGNRGRYRREHEQGSVLTFQGQCDRIFIAPELKNKITNLAEKKYPLPDDDDESEEAQKLIEKFIGYRGTLFEEMLNILNGTPSTIEPDLNKESNNASFTLKEGWHLFDKKGIKFHVSAGLVTEKDESANTFFEKDGETEMKKAEFVKWD